MPHKGHRDPIHHLGESPWTKYKFRMSFKRSSHAVYECLYHVIWVTKYRKRVLTLEHERAFCERVLRRAAAEYGMEIVEIEVDVDHVHIQIGIPPQKSVGKGIGILKSVSARLMFKRFEYLRRKLWAGELWGDSYFVRTVGHGVTAATVKRYIEQHADKGLESAQGELFPTGKARP
ncbi:MAG: IS200/IS605 family transposase [Bdellovibrionales bacterium]|nr:IS200/IS605 family transposase [Bdellovibrionales bacterium]